MRISNSARRAKRRSELRPRSNTCTKHFQSPATNSATRRTYFQFACWRLAGSRTISTNGQPMRLASSWTLSFLTLLRKVEKGSKSTRREMLDYHSHPTENEKKCWLDVLNLPHGRDEKQKKHQT